MYLDVHICIHIYVYMYICMYIFIYGSIYLHIYTYVYIHIHAVRVAQAGIGMTVRRYSSHPAAYMVLSTVPSIGIGGEAAISSSLGEISYSHLNVKESSEVQQMEQTVEMQVKGLICSLREDEGLSTKFDEVLSIILQPALYAYEFERVLGAPAASVASTAVNSDFQGAIKQYVGRGKGQCFKAYPTCLSCLADSASIKKTLYQAAAARDIMFTASATPSTTGFAVRAKVFPYPAGVFALWIMISVRYDGSESTATSQ
jgi:hypothetical protein